MLTQCQECGCTAYTERVQVSRPVETVKLLCERCELNVSKTSAEVGPNN